MDLVYLARSQEPYEETDDCTGFQWFSLEEVFSFNNNKIFVDTKEIIQALSKKLDSLLVSIKT